MMRDDAPVALRAARARIFDVIKYDRRSIRSAASWRQSPSDAPRASSILAKAHQGIDAVAERKAGAAARRKSLCQLIDPYLLVRATGDASGRKMRQSQPAARRATSTSHGHRRMACRSSK
jgi:hypothetical protein